MASVFYCFCRSCQALGIGLMTLAIVFVSLAWFAGLVTA
jgi:hypothetical protein